MVVKAESAVMCIQELDFEIPANSQKGQVTAVESVIRRAISNLESDQPIRMVGADLWTKEMTTQWIFV